MEARRDVFQAIADPTRRAIMDLLAGTPMNLNTLAENFDISRPAVSKHIRILTECGLVTIRQQGRERVCEPRPDALREVQTWIEKYAAFWDQKLHALDTYLSRENNRNHS
ncbi:MAG TPA: metalloregulator ArsR/SmtB family transcription factor [Flavisolibacter sp.]